MINVYLDDMRPCPEGFIAAKSAEECLRLLHESEVNLLSLDYELGLGMPNGLSVVQGIIASGKFPKEVYVHSSSMMGRAQMVAHLKAVHPPGMIIHEGPIPIEVLKSVAKQNSSHA